MRWVGIWFALGALLGAAGLEPLVGHVDLRWVWDGEKWRLDAVAADDGEGVFDPAGIFLPLSDRPWTGTPVSGARIVQPNNATQDFTGVAVGDPSWYAVISLPGLGEAWPGFESQQGSAVFGGYLETDHRLPQPQSNPRPWIKVSMGEVFHDGPEGARFSMWTGTGSNPRVWMSTNNGQEDNFFLYAGGTHTHVNWTFGALGIYRIGLKASAFLGPGQTNPTGESEEVKVTFAVGPVARWQATHFSGEELEDATVSGLSADADGDGLVNLVEYAFGLDPRKGDRQAVAEGLGLPGFSLREEEGKFFQVLEFPRRKAGQLSDPLSYVAQFSGDMEGASWSIDGEETVVADLGAEWERVEVRREVAEGQRRGFGRVQVGFGD